MYNDDLEKVRDKLNGMLASGKYREEELLKVSEELDALVLQVIKEKLNLKDADAR